MGRANRRGRRSQDELKRRAEDALAAFENESDRAIPLIAQEWIDDALAELLYAEFAKNGASKDVQDSLLKDMSSPLGTFGVRVKSAGAIGLIPQDLCRTMNAFRLVRNHCAHGMKTVWLSDTDISGSIRQLREFSSNLMGTIGYEQLVWHATTKRGLMDSAELRSQAREFADKHVEKQNVRERTIVIIAAAFLVGYLRGAANQRSPQDYHVDMPPALPPLKDDSKLP